MVSPPCRSQVNTQPPSAVQTKVPQAIYPSVTLYATSRGWLARQSVRSLAASGCPAGAARWQRPLQTIDGRRARTLPKCAVVERWGGGTGTGCSCPLRPAADMLRFCWAKGATTAPPTSSAYD